MYRTNYRPMDYSTLGRGSCGQISLELPGCVIENPTDPTQCWIDDSQWKMIKWTGIGLLGVVVLSKAIPLIVDIKKSITS